MSVEQNDSYVIFNGATLYKYDRFSSLYTRQVNPIITRRDGTISVKPGSRQIDELLAESITDDKYYAWIYARRKIMKETPNELIIAGQVEYLKVITDEKTIAILKEIEGEEDRLKQLAESITI